MHFSTYGSLGNSQVKTSEILVNINLEALNLKNIDFHIQSLSSLIDTTVKKLNKI